MTNVRSLQLQTAFHAGLSALVQGLLSRQPQGFAGFGQLDPTQEIGLGSVEQRNYSYDPAGRRTGVSGAENATYGYDWRNQPTRTSDDVSSTKVTYDGLGRPVSRETETKYGSEAVTSSFFGGTQLGQVSTLHGASSSVWGVFGQLAGIDSEVTGEARWALLDRLGSVVAEAGGIAGVTGADIRELASYAEFGVPSYETGGFTSTYGYTGELQDAGTGVVAFGSRSYDAGSGTWMAPDAWPGLLVQPQSLNRYAYVLGDPVTLIDVGGFAATVPNASAAANHYNYSGGAWKPILNPLSKASAPNASAVTNHYDWDGSGWRAVLTPELESMREARHPDAARTCTSFSATPGCYPNGFRDMDYWKQHTSDVGDRIDASKKLAQSQIDDLVKRIQSGAEAVVSTTWSASVCAYLCVGLVDGKSISIGVGPAVGVGLDVGASSTGVDKSALWFYCAAGGAYFGGSVSNDPLFSTVEGIIYGLKSGCVVGITISTGGK